MAWTTYQPVTVAAPINSGVGATLRKGTKNPASLILAFYEDVAIKYNFHDAERIKVEVGDGEHHGMIRLIKNNSAQLFTTVKKGVTPGTKGKTVYLMDLGHLPQFVDRRETKKACKVEDDNGYLVVTLPSWRVEPPSGKATVAAPKGEPVKDVVATETPGKRSNLMEEAANFRRPSRAPVKSL